MAVDRELHDLGGAASLVAERLVGPVEGMHRVISERALRYFGPPIREVHDTMVGGVYQSIRRAADVLGAGAGALLASRLPAAYPVSGSPTGSGLQAALNAVWGDELDARQNALAVSLTVRDGDRAVAIDRASLAAAFPDATEHIVVLLHGLGQTEQCWRSSSDGAAGVFESLASDPQINPVLIRYNSGLAVARTGQEVAALLALLSASWPAAGSRVSLVGYSMGGLVARSAYAAGIATGLEWAARARDLVTVGAPHHGSPVARGVRLGSRALRVARTSRPLSDFLETASAGIKDLEDGAGIAEAWEAAVAIPDGGPSGVRQHFVAAVVTGDARHPVGVLVGDLIVRVASASGRTLAPDNVRVLGGRRHFKLLSDPNVIDQIVEWLRAGD